MPDTAAHALQIPTKSDSIYAVHDLLEKVFADRPTISAMNQSRFKTALIELTSNIFRHGGSRDGTTLDIHIATFRDRIEGTLTHRGAPWDAQLARRTMPTAMAESGRGIPLAHALVDEIHYGTDGDRTHCRIVKRLAS